MCKILGRSMPSCRRKSFNGLIQELNANKLKSRVILSGINVSDGAKAEAEQILMNTLKDKAKHLAFVSERDGKYRLIVAAHYPMVTKPEETIDALIELSN